MVILLDRELLEPALVDRSGARAVVMSQSWSRDRGRTRPDGSQGN
jgi:hypothetical protein